MKLQTCQQCGRKFQYNHQLRRHRKVHSLMNRTMYRCKICTASFTFLCNLRQHLAHHFNYKSGENLFIDDLAIGVTIEPVDNGGQDWMTKRGYKAISTRESPEGDPCYCVLADNCSVSLCDQACTECPRHFKSACRSSTQGADRSTVVPCCGRSSNRSKDVHGRCTFTRHINPEYVLHVDTTHDSTMTLKRNEDFSEKEVVEFTVTDSVSRQYKQICSQKCVAVRSATVSREDPHCRSCGDRECHCKRDQDGYDADSDQGEDNSDSDVYLDPEEKIPVISSHNEESVDYDHKAREKDCVDEMDDFDDDAACKDLSNMFPFSEFGENPQNSAPVLTCGSLISADVNSEELMEEFSDKEQPSTHTSGEFRPNNENKGLELSDMEVCAKSGLDSKAINPSVVVSDLQKDMNIMTLPCMRKEDPIPREHFQPVCESVVHNEKEEEHVRGMFSTMKRRRSERNLNKSTDNTTVGKENSPRGKSRDSRVSPRINKGCPPLKLQVQPSTDDKFYLSDNLKKKMGRAGKKQYYSKKGPQLKATFKKFDIECYICCKIFTTKQHFIIHAKDHLKRLGYDKNDLFYCTICFAFYPCENDLKEHLIDKHADEDMSPVNVKNDPQQSKEQNVSDLHPEQRSSFLNVGGQAVISSQQDVGYSGAHPPRYDMRNKNNGEPGVQSMHFDFGNSRCSNGSDSDIAESTTDQLSFRSDHESDSFGMGSQNHSNEFHPHAADPSFCMCHVCGETLPSMSYLAQHLKDHDPTTEKCLQSGPETRPRIYGPSSTSTFKCKVCNRGFAKLSEVQSHMIVHTPKRQRLKCPLCQGECMWKQNFKNHLLRHATPVGQTFNNVKFNPNSKILCPFCAEVSIFLDVVDFKQHMMEHVNRIMQEECSNSNYPAMIKKAAMERSKIQTINSAPPRQNMNPVPKKEPVHPAPPPPSAPAPYSVKCRTLTRQDLQAEMKAQSLSAGMTSTPNPYSSLNANPHTNFGSTPHNLPTSSIGSVDTSPEGSMRGNSGLFMSPEQTWQPSSSRSTQRPSSYTNINPQTRFNQGNSKYRSELNDSGFIQTFSGESDNNDAYQMAREAKHQPVKPETYSDPNKYEFINLSRVSELMTNTNTHTDDFTTEGFPCYICHLHKLTQANVKQHLFTHFDNTGRFNFVKKASKHECPMCLKMINDRRSATAHLFSHWGARIIKCPVCNSPFNLIKTMRIHVKKNHPHFHFTPEVYKMM